jgi:hypothetical protein
MSFSNLNLYASLNGGPNGNNRPDADGIIDYKDATEWWRIGEVSAPPKYSHLKL